MVIIGIDPGTLVCGFGVIKVVDNRYVPIDYGCIRPPQKQQLSKRYLIIHEGVEALIEAFSPDALVVETQYVKKNVQSAIKLGMARGAVVLASAKKGVPIFEYSPAEAKRAVVGNGQASKEQVQAMVGHLLSLESPPEPEDAADALALAICHSQRSLKPNIMEKIF